MTFTFSIAEKTITAEVEEASTVRYCKKYLSYNPADIFISADKADIEKEKKRMREVYGYDGATMQDYTDAFYERLVLYRKICEIMPAYDTILFHGSVVAVDGEAYLFTAKSGTGKSTHTRLWREYLGERAVMVNDDKPLLIIRDGGVFACGTPWCGKHALNTNIIVPLKAICILERSEINHIEAISQSEAWPMLMQQCYHPLDYDMMEKTFELADRLGSSVKLYRLGCNMDIEAAEIAYEAMKG